ncbi:AarF/ABC1/UbiB kinase family protein [Halorussus limi]|uniref:AarF/ABC1/UbiB kinase family protein n=1 Tax=Halorussus limi TaxID=2938695 RepID=A0A8U0HV84_9EURY|nr:AarF/ABC1/UbiB kinase family protein [Halorussus limi]UPV74858.1 AarF/ABC1/UbiB kinase family protein [Halorussus limi]
MVTLANLRAYRRFFVVAYHFLPLLLSYARDRRRYLLFGSRRRVDSRTRVERANTLLESLLTLGPTFIKLGQLLSTRPDVLPPEYVDVLSKLQDEVPPADWAEARAVLEDEVGPIEERFDEFDTDAISGASLGQVYTAEIDGEAVAVKVRRPNIEELVNADLRVIRWSLPILLRFLGQARAFSLENLADEFGRTIRQEMDYDREAAMLEEIRSNFEGNDDVAIPAVIDSHSGRRVLTMEYVTGTKINDVEELDAVGIDRHQLAVNLQEAYLQMLLEDGVFHADPHPGNLAVRDDGTIVFYDFGMSGRVDEFIQNKIIDFYIAVANQDIDGILDALIEMGTLSPDADRATMGKVMELAIEDARGEDIETYRVQQIVEQVEDTIYEFPLRLPSNLALVLRVATVVEGVCVTLDPDFDFISVATDYLSAQGYREESIKQFASETGDQIQRSIQSSVRVPPKLESALDRIERDDFYVRADVEDGNDVFAKLAKRLVYGMLLASGAFSTAFLYALTSVEAAAVAAAFSLVIAALLYRTFRERKGTRVTPQFTRHEMRQRRGGE